MRIACGFDHAGLGLRDAVLEGLAQDGHDVRDAGTFDDYPYAAAAVARALADGAERAVLVCGSGAGVSVAASKLPGVRAATVHDGYTAHQGVEHDDLNVLCLGARVVGPELARELVRTFAAARFGGEERHRRRLAQVAALGRVAWAREHDLLRRLWAKDASLWAPGDEDPAERLGWLTIAGDSLAQLDATTAFVEELRAEGFSDCALLGMGGSTLAPEVLRQTFGAAEGFLRLHVLDSTHPDAVAELEAKLPLERTLFLVSSKSGGTLEPRSMHAHFHALAPEGRQWAAVTDPGTALEALAREQGFRRVFHGAPDIGGRYSALSAFGVVPAALIGADVRGLLERAGEAAPAADPALPVEQAPALWLGLALGELALEGRDKLTFLVDAPLASLGLWLEQLVAESTGKQGKGIVPIADEPLGAVEEYGADRVFVHLRDTSAPPDAGRERQLEALAAAGHPVIPFPFAEPLDLGAQLFDWELAVAVAGAVIGINPFDQPDVQAAKDLTVATIDAYVRDGAFPAADADAVEGTAAAAALRALLDEHAGARAYVATMAYLAPDPALDEALTRLRLAIRRHSGAATTVGYGPRFLHSTGQLHKGGPPSGVFVQLVDEGRAGVAIPGAGYDFAALIRAQAIGDGQALRSHGLPFLRIHLTGDRVAAIAALAASLDREGSS
jgi:transaldolase/glucose-6-phosphate isomerase